MPTPGRQVLERLRQRLELVREEAARVRRDFDAVDRRMEECVARRGEALVELARHDLPDITHESIERSFEGIRDDLRSILARKERAQQELQGRLQRCQQAVEQLEAEVAAATEALNRLVDRRRELEADVAARLRKDPEFQRLSPLAIDAEQRLQADEQRAEEVQLEAAEKLPAYDRSALFQYLYRRGFGTPAYVHVGWRRSFDRWVARLIDYERHRRGYEFLRKTPLLVDAEVARRRADFHALMEQVEAIEDRVSDATGLTDVLRQGTEQGEARDRLIDRLTAEQSQRQQVEAELQALDQQQGRFYSEALARYAQFLARTETSLLQSRASQTPDPVDDEIVSRIAWLTSEIDRLKPEVAALGERSRAAEQRTEGLSFVVRRAEQANVDSDRCTTGDVEGIDRDLERFLAGAMNQNDLWRAIQDRLQFEATWVEATAAGAGQMLNHPASRVLLQVLVEAAASGMSSAGRVRSAERSIYRRTQAGQQRRTAIDRPSPGRGFSTRRGF